MTQEEPSAIRLEPRDTFDRFIMGVCELGDYLVLVYDKDAIISHLHSEIVSYYKDQDESFDKDNIYFMALEHFEFNFVQKTGGFPIYVSKDDLSTLGLPNRNPCCGKYEDK